MRAVDTNVLVRILTRDNADQTAIADAFIKGGAWVSVLALAETIWVLKTAYQSTAADLCDAVEMLLSHQDLHLEDADTVAMALALFRSRPTLGFSDCLILELARKGGHVPLGTFDRALAKASGTHRL
jgi:predicted nucleic-acid-binding protein